MGFVSLECGVCKGSRIEEVYGGYGTIDERPCSNCGGTGITTVHANSIGQNYRVSVDPASTDDECWYAVWRRKDDGTLEVIDMGKAIKT